MRTTLSNPSITSLLRSFILMLVVLSTSAFADSHQSKIVSIITSSLLSEGPAVTYYYDADSDTYGDPDISLSATSQPVDYVLDNTDCDDNNPNINPGATEILDDIDNDCDDQTDEDIPVTYYYDGDSDTYGNPLISLSSSSQPISYVLDNTDCDDGDGNTYPGATEVIDGVDNNCNGQIDEPD